ncbi:MAG: TrbC/VirB2 family protein [Synergistaceae bacterium]|jgi:type IV secretion system protein VirB2|nr:TrbC/VirB2 family protein [Synergistaceae bacterium]
MQRKIFWVIAALLTGTAVAAFADAAFAAGTNTLPWDSGLSLLRDSITGPVAMVVSLIAIVGAGAMLLFGGNIQGFMRTTVYLVLVLGIIVSASGFLSAFYTTSALLPL